MVAGRGGEEEEEEKEGTEEQEEKKGGEEMQVGQLQLLLSTGRSAKVTACVRLGFGRRLTRVRWPSPRSARAAIIQNTSREPSGQRVLYACRPKQ